MAYLNVMKTLTSLFLLSYIFISPAYAQHSEFSVHLNSGFFSFGGESATERSFIIVSDISTIENYTNNPYGTQSKLAYGISAQYHRITKNKLIFGLQTGYEILRSEVSINDVAIDLIDPPSSATGHTIFRNDFINVYPNIGRRFKLNDLDIDLTMGPELGFNIISKEKGEATTNTGLLVETDHNRNHNDTDFRLRSSLTVYYNNWGITTGYSYGLSNYSAESIGGNSERFSRFIRFGVSYTIPY